jgi:hypothetical protein
LGCRENNRPAGQGTFVDLHADHVTEP